MRDTKCKQCGEPSDSICDSCGKVVCYGCCDNSYDDANVCTECAMQLRDEELAKRQEGT